MSKLERMHNGRLWSHTSIGSYPIVYTTADNSDLCPACANGENGSEALEDHEDKQWRLVDAYVHWEGPPVTCENCNAQIESAYGDPDEESADAL